MSEYQNSRSTDAISEPHSGFEPVTALYPTANLANITNKTLCKLDVRSAEQINMLTRVNVSAFVMSALYALLTGLIMTLTNKKVATKLLNGNTYTFTGYEIPTGFALFGGLIYQINQIFSRRFTFSEYSNIISGHQMTSSELLPSFFFWTVFRKIRYRITI